MRGLGNTTRKGWPLPRVAQAEVPSDSVLCLVNVIPQQPCRIAPGLILPMRDVRRNSPKGHHKASPSPEKVAQSPWLCIRIPGRVVNPYSKTRRSGL